MYGEGGWMGSGMWVFWILLLVVIVVLVKVLAFSGSGSSNQSNENPLDILKSRYARGEIGEEEFERRKKGLEK